MTLNSCSACQFGYILRIPTLLIWHDCTQKAKFSSFPRVAGISPTGPLRFAALGYAEFHLYDREVTPETERRQRAVELVNARPYCRGFLTSKRSLENYLHPYAIAQAGGGEIPIGEDECIGSVLAHYWYELIPQANPWTAISRRARRRLIYRAKRWLNRQAVDQMTIELLHERDPGGEILQWLKVISDMTTPQVRAGMFAAAYRQKL